MIYFHDDDSPEPTLMILLNDLFGNSIASNRGNKLLFIRNEQYGTKSNKTQHLNKISLSEFSGKKSRMKAALD
jgi:hypothetical protein